VDNKEITPQQVKDAKQLIADYETNLSKKYTPDFYTRICCKVNKIEPLYDKPNALEQQQGMWHHGVLISATCGYGSRHDMDTYFMAVCDDCIDKLEQDEMIINRRELSDKITGEVRKTYKK
jgi:hypothetical protein